MKDTLRRNEERNWAVQIEHHRENEVVDFPRIEKAIAQLEHLLPGRALDIGYCSGSFADYLRRRGWWCVGLDLCRRPGSPIRTVGGDVQEGMPFGAGTFDLITAGEIIEHMFDESALLQECRRLLKPEGWLVITTPNLAYSLNRIRVLLGMTPLFVYAPYHYHFHTASTLRALLERNGFAVRRLTSSHVLYSRRRHFTGRFFEWLGDLAPRFGAHLIVLTQRT